MPKGRIHAPSVEKDGIWFHHPSCQINVDGSKTRTTTQIMLEDVYNTKAHIMSTARCPDNYIDGNPFSLHDNRHTIQHEGEYLLQGLGRKKATQELSQHKSDNLTEWRVPGERQSSYSIYRGDYAGDPTEDPPRHRRFPKVYSVPEEGIISIEPNVTRWLDDSEERDVVDVQVLADSQEPYPKHNPWKYSYHRHSFAIKDEKKK